jgi:hypothetical protein
VKVKVTKRAERRIEIVDRFWRTRWVLVTTPAPL